MTRSFGDKAGMRAGTIAEPEINQYNIDEKNKYLLVASDGVWQHIQNHEIVKILSKTLKEEKIEEIADKLMESVCRIWDEKCISRDDVTFILVKIDREKREEK